MASIKYVNSPNVASGYRCVYCGKDVRIGYHHHCDSQPTINPLIFAAPIPDDPTIYVALRESDFERVRQIVREEIKTALEEM